MIMSFSCARNLIEIRSSTGRLDKGKIQKFIDKTAICRRRHILPTTDFAHPDRVTYSSAAYRIRLTFVMTHYGVQQTRKHFRNSIRIRHDWCTIYIITGSNCWALRRGNIILLRSKTRSAPIHVYDSSLSPVSAHAYVHFSRDHQRMTVWEEDASGVGNIVYYIV